MQTAYLPLQSLGKVSPDFLGGICQFWYVPIQFIDSFGEIDPVTQQLIDPPTLKPGFSWFGPVNVPDQKRGWKQTLDRTKAGPYWKQLVTGSIPGNDANNHINRQNLAYHQVVVVALLRAGGFFIILGNNQTGLGYDEETDTGGNQFDTPDTKFSFAGEGEALVLTQFAGITSMPSPTAPAPVTPGGTITVEPFLYEYEANGTEGNTITVGDVSGKTILLFSREDVLLTVITSGSPNTRQALRTGTTFQFAVDLQAGDHIKILYK